MATSSNSWGQPVSKGILSIFMLLFALPSFGQGRLEVQPFVGLKWGGSTDVRANALGITKLKLDSSVAYGVSATFNATHNFGIEFLWNEQPTNAVPEGSIAEPKTGVHVDQFHGNLVLSFGQEEHKMRPFLLFGLGASRIAGAGDSVTKFSFGIGGGVKYFMTPKWGVRAQLRYAPTYLYSTSGGVWCDWYGFCFVVPNDHYLNQGDATLGLIYRF